MKSFAAVVAMGAALVAAQQDVTDLPQCGQVCVANMLALAPSIGCDGTDAACLCASVNFGYGVRDCANENCGNAQDAAQAIAYGAAYCQNAIASNTALTVSAAYTALTGASVISLATTYPTTSMMPAGTGVGIGLTTSASVLTTPITLATGSLVPGDNGTVIGNPLSDSTATVTSVSVTSVSSGEASATDGSGTGAAGAGSDNDDNNDDSDSSDSTDTSSGSAAMQTAAPLLGMAALAIFAL